ncbi:MAG: hypothetical protein EXR93_04550 [Gemmatimonadetes bacterium]|nr:hypothetical protein [Gemmatimonadota bacterium]
MIAFHRFLIATAILFCGGFALWSIVAFRADGGLLPLSLGISFALAAGLLSYYLKHLRRFLNR